MATLRPIDGSWVIDWRDSQGRHREVIGRCNILSERDAKRVLHDKKLKLEAGYQTLNPNAAPTFGKFTVDYLSWHEGEYPASHERIAQIVAQHLMPEFQFLALDRFNPRDVEAWKHRRLAPRDDKPKAETVGKELRTLKAILAKAVEWKVIREHPIPHVSSPLSLDSKPPIFFTQAELDQIYAACKVTVNSGEGPQPSPIHAAMWRLFANTGMRRGEGQMLKRAWVGREAMKILSTEEDRTKSGKWREIPLTKGARIALDELPKSGGLVMPVMTPQSLSRSCVHDIRRAGITTGSLHTLRHTYISHLVMAGIDLRTVQKLAGHSTVAVTERYAHLAPGHLLSAGKAISL